MPDGSVTGEVTDEPQEEDDRTKGRKSLQEPTRQGEHLASNHQDWENRMVGESLYQQTPMIMRKMGIDTNVRKISSRKWAECECCIKIGENGEDWETISVILWRMGLKDAFSHHVLVSTYGISEISMGHIREEGNPRGKLMIGETGNARNVASVNAMVETTAGIVGARSLVEVNASLAARGKLTEMHVPGY